MKKVILLGDINVGKTMFVRCLRNPKTPIIPTIGVDCFKYNNMQVWDTSGDPRFKLIVNIFFKEMDAYIMLYRTEEQLHAMSMEPSKTVVLLYNGTDMELCNKGADYALERNWSFFECNVNNVNENKWTWNRISEILHRQPVVKTDKAWRYCWFY